MAKKKNNSALTLLFVGILFIFVGGGALGLTLMFGGSDPDKEQLFKILTYVCAGVAVLGVILLIAGIVSGKRRRKQSSAQVVDEAPSPERIDNGAAVEPDYVFRPESYEFVTVGRRQSTEDKFNEIGKMGKTQFVIYMCKLFSLKGYEVTYTPVADNHEIDLVIKRDGVIRAVGCLLANKVMCAEDIKPI